MRENKTWYGLVLIAFVSLAFILYGFFEAVRFTSGIENEAAVTAPPASAAPTAKNPDSIQVLIIGDSIARGTGDEKLKGFGGNLTELMKDKTAKDIVVENAGVDGLRTSELLQQVRSGRMDSAIEAADYVLISIGGNDLREIQSMKDVAKETAYREKRDAYVSGLGEIVKKTRAVNQEAVLIIIGLYDPTAADNANENARYVTAWNGETQTIAAQDQRAVFIPTYDLFRFNLDRYMAGDKLHPNSAGYQAISSLIARDIETTLK